MSSTCVRAVEGALVAGRLLPSGSLAAPCLRAARALLMSCCCAAAGTEGWLWAERAPWWARAQAQAGARDWVLVEALVAGWVRAGMAALARFRNAARALLAGCF